MPEEKGRKSLYLTPFILTAAIVLADRLSKNWIVANVPEGTIWKEYFGDFLWICHIRNKGVAFSFGNTLPPFIRFFFFTLCPIIMMIYIVYLIAGRKSSLTSFQRWMAAGVLGGGIGTVIDRLLYFDQGVIDFISIKIFCIFGLDRWPTFNISDSCVVGFVIVLALSVLLSDGGEKK